MNSFFEKARHVFIHLWFIWAASIPIAMAAFPDSFFTRWLLVIYCYTMVLAGYSARWTGREIRYRKEKKSDV